MWNLEIQKNKLKSGFFYYENAQRSEAFGEQYVIVMQDWTKVECHDMGHFVAKFRSDGKGGKKLAKKWRILAKYGEFYVKKSGSTEKCFFFKRFTKNFWTECSLERGRAFCLKR
jgi:hypothetical protein